MDNNEKLQNQLKERDKELQLQYQLNDHTDLTCVTDEYQKIEILDIQPFTVDIMPKCEDEEEIVDDMGLDEEILDYDDNNSYELNIEEIKEEQFIIEETIVDEVIEQKEPIKKKIKLMVIDHRPSAKLPRVKSDSTNLDFNKINTEREQDGSKENLLCSTCGVVCQTKAKYFSHMQRHNPLYIKKLEEKISDIFECNICQEAFALRVDFLKHNKIHKAPTQQYVCDYCGKSFKAPSFLKIHSYTHTGIKPFVIRIFFIITYFHYIFTLL